MHITDCVVLTTVNAVTGVYKFSKSNKILKHEMII